MKSNGINQKVVQAITILAASGHYTEKELYEFFDLLMGFSTVGDRLDTWGAILPKIQNHCREVAVTI